MSLFVNENFFARSHVMYVLFISTLQELLLMDFQDYHTNKNIKVCSFKVVKILK